MYQIKVENKKLGLTFERVDEGKARGTRKDIETVIIVLIFLLDLYYIKRNKQNKILYSNLFLSFLEHVRKEDRTSQL